MITEEELRISNKSYVNKDFASIYPEVVDLVKKLTNIWNPETSNESDPGVVILKLLAFIADKNNYNIDKNVLEDFMVSCTQESSMRKICDMLGYFMNYYNAPTTKVTISYSGNLDENKNITLTALDTVFTNNEDDSNVSYILTEDCTLSQGAEIVQKSVIQGRLKELVVNTSNDYSNSTTQSNSLIQLSNLDDNNRIYFPEINVAQNGIFILDDTSTTNFWKRVENLNYQKADERCFKFGFDSSRSLPYIEFPRDIANLIGNGLYIRYVVTDGLNGNVKANVINTLQDSTYDWSDNGYDSELLYVRNYSATIDGTNPESIDEAYNGFKKTVGTFNTLVSCRDYANAIFNALDKEGLFPLVSNVQVSDRRDDINYSKRVASYDELGEVTLNLTDASTLNAYQLCAYPLAPIYSFTNIEAYNESFMPLTRSSDTVTANIDAAIEANKTISHDFKSLDANAIYTFKNKLALNGKLTTTYKVNANEVLDIDTNVINKLIKDFNARKVDYGYEIPYDSLINAIQNADKRINFVSLMEPELTTWAMKYDGTEFPLMSADGKDAYIKYLTSNLFNGNVSLFDYDKRFNYDLGQKKIPGINMVNEHISKIISDLWLTLYNDVDTPLYKNEVIQLVGPNVITKITYPAYVWVNFTGSHHDYTNPIPANTIYQLRGNEVLTFIYTQDDTTTIKEYKAGDLIKNVGFDLYNTPSDNSYYDQIGRSVTTKIYNGTAYPCISLTAQESVEILEVNTVELTKKTKCYWLRNNDKNRLFTDDEWKNGVGEILLGENEYFFYTDASETQLVSLGSGTTIKTDLATLRDATCELVSIEDVLESGMMALKDKWKIFNFSSQHELYIQENTILTLTENDSIRVVYSDVSSGSPLISTSNKLVEIGDNVESIYYTIYGEEPEPLSMYRVAGSTWRIRSLLRINVTEDEPQVINDGVDNIEEGVVRQSVLFYLYNSALPVILNKQFDYFNLNTELHTNGGVVDTSITFDDTAVDVDLKYPVSMYCYNILIDANGDEIIPNRDLSGYDNHYNFTSDATDLCDYVVPVIRYSGTLENSVIMMHLYATGSGDVTVVATNCGVRQYNSDVNFEPTYKLVSGINVIEITLDSSFYDPDSDNVPSIKIVNSGNSGLLTLGTLDYFKGLNKELAIKEFAEAQTLYDESELTNALLDSIRNQKFYYNCKIDNSKAIESDSLLSPYAFYDANNRANKFTISQIDFDASDIDVVRSSKL